MAFDGSVHVEVLCPSCHDLRLDGTSTTHPPRYVQIDQTPGVEEGGELATDEECAAARFLFQGGLLPRSPVLSAVALPTHLPFYGLRHIRLPG